MRVLRLKSFVIFLSVLWVSVCSEYHAQGLEIQFDHLGVRDGLSQATAYCIYEDRLGFIWVGTDDGLNRYDGYECIIFREDPLDERSLSNNSVNAIQEDSNGNLWVGTDQGLNLLFAERMDFKTHKFDFHDPGSLSSNTVWCMTLDADDRLWIGTANGLNRYSTADSSFTKYKSEVDDPFSLSNNSVNALYTDSSGTLWIGTNQGLNRWNVSDESFDHFDVPGDLSRYGQVIQCIGSGPQGELLVGTNQGVFVLQDSLLTPSVYTQVADMKITACRTDKQGDLWIGTNSGLYHYLKGRSEPILHIHDEQNNTSISDDNINYIHEDSTDILWIGTYSGGVNLYYREQQQIFHYDNENLGRTVFPSDIVNCIEQVSLGEFWLGTEAGIGILRDATTISGIRTAIPEELNGKSVKCILSRDELLAVGTDRDGVVLIDRTNGEVTTLRRRADGTGLIDDRIASLEWCGDDLWIGTQGSGINIYSTVTDSLTRIQYAPASKGGLADNRIVDLQKQGTEAMWIGTASEGVQRYSIEDGTFTDYAVRQDSSRMLSSDKVLCIYFDSAVLWVGTKGGGVNKIDLLTDQVQFYTTENGLANNVVYDIRSDHQGRLWMTTNNGISVLDIENENFINYNEIDGLGNQTFLPSSGLSSRRGEIFFGGRQGLDIIRYQDIETNSVLPKVYFTQMQVFDSKQNQYDPDLSRNLVHEIETIELRPEMSLITLGFSGLNYRRPEKNTYAYRLAGLTDEWTFIGDRRYVTFSELPPGDYQLQVKAANNDGRWSEEPSQIYLSIIPAFYQTNWFKALLVIFFALMVFLFNQYRLRRVRSVNRKLEKRVKLRTAQIAKERDEKAILLQEIHHRVKNNLQIVNSLLRLQSHYVKDEEALWALDESQNRVMSMAMIHERMYKTENLANINIPDYIRDLCTDIINTYDLSNNVTLDLDIQVEKLNLDTLTPLGLIINEISSNAMKYAFPDGRSGIFKIHLTAIEPGKKFKLIIGDNGVGMPVDLSDTEQDSLGTTLMESLSEQLNGELKRMDGPGTFYEMNFEQLKDSLTE
ncbi:MAG: hypothetical protein HKN79_02665 [Flavobacteriales bacterium]|nr:hypothetical protein [Flavobacteriales bacterium]